MTGREAAIYMLVNGFDEYPLVVYIDGKPVQVYSICYEPSRKELVVLPDYRFDDEKGE
jgi:hypothetical protein